MRPLEAVWRLKKHKRVRKGHFIEKHYINYISMHHMLIFCCPARRRFYRAIAL